MTTTNRLHRGYRHNLFGFLAIGQCLLLIVATIGGNPFWILTGEIVFVWYAFYLLLLNRSFSLTAKTVRETIARYWGLYFLRLIMIGGVYGLIFGLNLVFAQEVNIGVGFGFATGLILLSRIWVLRRLTLQKEKMTNADFVPLTL